MHKKKEDMDKHHEIDQNLVNASNGFEPLRINGMIALPEPQPNQRPMLSGDSPFQQSIAELEQKLLNLRQRMEERVIQRQQQLQQQQQQQQQNLGQDTTIARLSRYLIESRETNLELNSRIDQQMVKIERLQLSNAKMAKELAFGQARDLWKPE